MSGTQSQPVRRRRTEEFAASHRNNQSAAGTVQFFNGYRRNAALAAAQEDERHVTTHKRVLETTWSWRSVEDGVSVILLIVMKALLRH